MEETTVLTKATPRSRSLRSTVPVSIVKLLGLKEGDRLLWEVKVEGNDFIIIVKPRRENFEGNKNE